MGIKFSQFINAFDIFDDDYLVGVQTGANKRFTMLRLLQWFKSKITSSDISYDPTTSGASATNVKDALDEAFSDLSDKQDEITANGILKGDGAGGVSAATAGTDYATPGMIPIIPSAYTSNPAMDGTASPGSSGAWAKGDHVHPSDTTKANQAQIAYVETGTTASRAYAVGEYFCWNGLLYRAKTAISSGGTITPGTNCERATGGGLNQIAPKLLMSEWVTGTGDYSIASLRLYNLFIVRVIGNDVNFRTLVVSPGVSTQINVDATASIYVRMTMLIDYINLKVSVTNISSAAWAGGTLQVWGVALPV